MKSLLFKNSRENWVYAYGAAAMVLIALFFLHWIPKYFVPVVREAAGYVKDVGDWLKE